MGHWKLGKALRKTPLHTLALVVPLPPFSLSSCLFSTYF
jgi:hypothetical protein